jgi:hypothetical protein
MVEPKQILAAINPALYNKKPTSPAEKEKLELVKSLAKEGKILEAAETRTQSR